MLSLTVNCALASVVFVRKEATGAGNGTSWADAYTNPQTAFASAAPGDEVWIAQGVYHPGALGQTGVSFALPSGVAVYGGFSGSEAQRTQRNWTQHPTVFSGDLADDDVFGNPWWTNWSTNSANSLHVVTVLNGVPGTVFDGFVVSNGNAVSSRGGGLYAESTQLVLRNCTFRRNSGYQGRGSCLYMLDGHLTAVNCTFSENWGRFTSGVGIATDGSAGALVDRCTFYDNHAESDASLGNGAGIEFWGSSPSTVLRSRFLSNVSLPFGGGQYPSYGAGIHNFGAPLTVDRCVFEGNTGVNGGGIYSWKDLTVSNSLFRSNKVYALNTAGGFGGAVATFSYFPYTLKVVGCTIVNNIGHETGGIWYGGGSTFTTDVSGCVLWGNSDVDGIVSQAQVKKASYSCVQNLWVTRPGEDPIDPEKFPNCSDSDPRFVAFPTDVRLQLTSPCIDAADKTKYGTGGFLDLDSLFRFVDIANVTDTGKGSPPLPDMGCYEACVGRHVGASDDLWAISP